MVQAKAQRQCFLRVTQPRHTRRGASPTAPGAAPRHGGCRRFDGGIKTPPAQRPGAVSLLRRTLLDRVPEMSSTKLEHRLLDDHSALRAALRAPVESETDEEREAVEAAMDSGPLVPGSIVTAELTRRAHRIHG